MTTPKNQIESAEIKALKPVAGAKCYRAMSFTRDAVDIENRTVELSFSSEEPYERWFGNEILSHAAGAMNTQFLASGNAPALLQHDTSQQIGVVLKLLQSEGRGRALVKFSKGALGDEIFQDVVDRIRSCVSVGYIVNKSECDETTNPPTYTVTDWTPLEISIVSIPADTTVGVGRSADPTEIKETETLKTETKEKETQEEKRMPDPNHPAENKAATAIDVEAEKTKAANEARAAEIARFKNLQENGVAFRDYGGVELAAEIYAKGGTEADFVREMRGRVGKKSADPVKTDGRIGLTEREAQNFSFVRLLRAMTDDTGMNKRELAPFEYEVCTAAAKQRSGGNNGAMTIPLDVLTRAAADGSQFAASNAGQNILVPKTTSYADFIGLLRNKLITTSLNARYMSGLVGEVTLPKQSGTTSAEFINEGESGSESSFTVAGVTLKKHTVTARTSMTRDFLNQTTPDAENIVRDDLAQAMAQKIDAVTFYGAGDTAKEPKGLFLQDGITLINKAGAAITWHDVNHLRSSVSAANAAAGSLGFVTNSFTCGILREIPKVAGQAVFILGDDGKMAGFPTLESNQILDTRGANSNLSSLIFGDFSQIVIGSWGGLEIRVDPYTKMESGSVRIALFQDIDVAVRHPEAFAILDGIDAIDNGASASTSTAS